MSAKRTNVARAISAAGDSSSPQPTPSQPSVQSRCQSISVPDGTLSNCGRWYTVEDGPFKGIYRFKEDEAYVLQCSKKTRRMFEQQVSRSMVWDKEWALHIHWYLCMCAHNPFCGYCGVCLQHWQTHGPPIDRFCSLVAIPTLSLITTMLRSQKNCMTDCICEVPCICRPALAFQMSNNHKFCLVEGGSWSTRENSLVGAGPLFPKGHLERIHGGGSDE